MVFYFCCYKMMADGDDDEWVRVFNVSDPLKAYAGHTLYKITSKVRYAAMQTVVLE